jgi:hypothetical protein
MRKLTFIIFLFLMIISLGILCSCIGKEGPVGPQGEQGIQGEMGNGISSIEKTLSEGIVDTYTITYTDGTTTTFTVTNGKDGIDGINGKPGEDGHTPVITIVEGYWHIDGVNTNVRAEGLQGEIGNGISSIEKTLSEGLVDTYTITYTDGSTSTFTVTNGKDGKTAYEIYLKYHPEYTGSEAQWIHDFISGKLETDTFYTVSFDSVGGTEIESQVITEGKKASIP